MRSFFICTAILLTVAAWADPFAEGNLVVTQVGDGSGPLNNTAARVFLREFTSAGSTRQLIDATASATPVVITNSGVGTFELALSRSTNGDLLSFAGYNAVVGTSAIAFTSASAVNRVVATVNGDGLVSTATRLSDAFNLGAIRCAYTVDGTRFWLAGTNGAGQELTGGLRYCLLGATSSTRLSTDTISHRLFVSFANQLYSSPASSGQFGVSQVGTGLPTTPPQPVTLLPGFPETGASFSGFAFLDADTLYTAEDNTNNSAYGVQKWTRSAGVWSRAYGMHENLLAGARRLCLRTEGGQTVIYALSSEATANRLVRIVDQGPLSPCVTIAQAQAGTAWRGINWAPVAAGTKVNPSGFTVYAGYEIGGDLVSLRSIDEDSLIIFNDEDSLQTGVEITGTSPIGIPRQLRVEVSQFAGRPGLSVALMAKNFALNRYDTVAGGPSQFTLQTLIATITTSPQRYIGFGGTVNMRVQWQPINDEDPSQDGWPVSIDQATWNVQA